MNMSLNLDYDGTMEFHEGMAVVYKVHPIPKEEMTEEMEDLGIDSYETYGFIDDSGKVIVPCKYEEANDFSDGMALVKTEKGFGFIDKTGKEAIPCKYDYARDFHEGLACVDDGYLFIDRTGREVLRLPKDIIPGDFSEGLASAVRVGAKRGYIDKCGQVVIPCEYDEVGAFHEGRALVRIGEKSFYIDRAGNWLEDYNPEPEPEPEPDDDWINRVLNG